MPRTTFRLRVAPILNVERITVVSEDGENPLVDQNADTSGEGNNSM
jgi:hypothetical protein